MSNYRVALTASAEKELHRLPAQMVARIVPRLEGLSSAPRPPVSRNSAAAITNGVFVWVITESCTKIDDSARTVDVTRIAHRREVYER